MLSINNNFATIKKLLPIIFMGTVLSDCSLKLGKKATVKIIVVYLNYRQQFSIVAEFCVAKIKKCCSAWGS